MRLVGPNGEQVGIVRVEDALRLAQEADLDLVEVAPQAKPPVCKLMDFGKFKYESAMKDREARKNQTNTVLKTVRLRLKIDPHDYETKKGFAEKFLEGGDKVKVMIMFRGREQSRPEMGLRLLQRFAGDVAELGAIESSPQQDGRNMVMVIGPTRRKADVKAEQKAEQRDRRDADRAARAERTQREREEQAERQSSAPEEPEAPQVSPLIAEGDEPLFVRRAPQPAAPAAREGGYRSERPDREGGYRGGDRDGGGYRGDRGGDRPDREGGGYRGGDRPDREGGGYRGGDRDGGSRPPRTSTGPSRPSGPPPASRPVRPAMPRPAVQPGAAPGPRPTPAAPAREGAAPTPGPGPSPAPRPGSATPGPRPTPAAPRPTPRPARPTPPPPSGD
ncbi:translation initiation factor IF-3 [Quadrisphaera setariae]|uniref:translation initiation factor IF-3 n=1 Tax=Quadrisphaera setariae TaxID=2593304 RepID=UPI0034E2DFE7